ncbi:hypothetical protein GGX14DRAFT_610408 [Mycena pura]|uniref:Uncharacterized protein n=1 Tax=Mycena pura TaxID=153505 RepID=A0AAD6UK40_9AGAR|nr:hypothetical protein GGX14DRAFT_610408 [Mycena pura]
MCIVFLRQLRQPVSGVIHQGYLGLPSTSLLTSSRSILSTHIVFGDFQQEQCNIEYVDDVPGVKDSSEEDAGPVVMQNYNWLAFNERGFIYCARLGERSHFGEDGGSCGQNEPSPREHRRKLGSRVCVDISPPKPPASCTPHPPALALASGASQEVGVPRLRRYCATDAAPARARLLPLPALTRARVATTPSILAIAAAQHALLGHDLSRVYFVFCTIVAVYSWDLSLVAVEAAGGHGQGLDGDYVDYACKADCAGSALHPGGRAECAHEVLRLHSRNQGYACGVTPRPWPAHSTAHIRGLHDATRVGSNPPVSTAVAHRARHAHAPYYKLHPPTHSLSLAYRCALLVCCSLPRYRTRADAPGAPPPSPLIGATRSVVGSGGWDDVALDRAGTTAMSTARCTFSRPMLVASRTPSRLKTCRLSPMPVVRCSLTRSRPREHRISVVLVVSG